jgi:hypothetical protein
MTTAVATPRISWWLLMPCVELGVVALWFLWMAAPPSVIPYLGFDVDVYGPPLVLGAVLAVAVGVRVVRREARQEVLGWISLAVLTGAFVLAGLLTVWLLDTLAALSDF